MAMPLRAPIQVPTYTTDDLRRIPHDGQRYELLDGFLLVTWEAAKHVVSGPQVKSDGPVVPTPAEGPGSSGQAGEVKPAA